MVSMVTSERLSFSKESTSSTKNVGKRVPKKVLILGGFLSGILAVLGFVVLTNRSNNQTPLMETRMENGVWNVGNKESNMDMKTFEYEETGAEVERVNMPSRRGSLSGSGAPPPPPPPHQRPLWPFHSFLLLCFFIPFFLFGCFREFYPLIKKKVGMDRDMPTSIDNGLTKWIEINNNFNSCMNRVSCLSGIKFQDCLVVQIGYSMAQILMTIKTDRSKSNSKYQNWCFQIGEKIFFGMLCVPSSEVQKHQENRDRKGKRGKGGGVLAWFDLCCDCDWCCDAYIKSLCHSILFKISILILLTIFLIFPSLVNQVGLLFLLFIITCVSELVLKFLPSCGSNRVKENLTQESCGQNCDCCGHDCDCSSLCGLCNPGSLGHRFLLVSLGALVCPKLRFSFCSETPENAVDRKLKKNLKFIVKNI